MRGNGCSELLSPECPPTKDSANPLAQVDYVAKRLGLRLSSAAFGLAEPSESGRGQPQSKTLREAMSGLAERLQQKCAPRTRNTLKTPGLRRNTANSSCFPFSQLSRSPPPRPTVAF